MGGWTNGHSLLLTAERGTNCCNPKSITCAQQTRSEDCESSGSKDSRTHFDLHDVPAQAIFLWQERPTYVVTPRRRTAHARTRGYPATSEATSAIVHEPSTLTPLSMKIEGDQRLPTIFAGT